MTDATTAAVERAKQSAIELQRVVVKQELESELRGLLMACRMHKFALVLREGRIAVEEVQ